MSGQAQGGYYNPQQHYPDQHQQQQQPQHPYSPYSDGTLNTVSEEEEPQPSPEIGRAGGQWGHDYSQGGAGQGGQQYDYSAQQGAGAVYDYQQQQQQQGQYDYAGQQQQQHDYSGYNQQQQQQHYDPTPVSSNIADTSSHPQQFDVPVYPGWVYNPTTNSYDPDLNYDPNEVAGEGQQAEQQGGHDGYAGYEQQQGSEYGQGGAAEQQNGGEYASQPNAEQAQSDYYSGYADQQDPYAQQGGQAQSEAYSAEPAADPYAAQSSADPYANEPDPYANEPDPYAQEQHQHDPYAADSNPYEEQQSDPYAAASDPFTAPPQQAADPYAPAAQQQQAPPPASKSYNAYQPAPQQQQQSQAPPSTRQNAYSPTLSPQQFSSFAAFDAPPPSVSPAQPLSAPHDPYAPAPRQPQQQRARSGTASSQYDPYSPVSQVQQQQQRREASGGSQYDPYAPRGASAEPPAQQQQQQGQYDPYGSQQQSAPLSPPMTHSPMPRAPQQQQYPGMTSPTLTARSAFSPPPRSTSAISAASNAHRPPPQSTQQNATPAPARLSVAAPPPRSSSAASNRSEAPPPAQAPAQAAPPPKSAAPPPRANGAAGGPPRATGQYQAPPSSGAAFDIPPPRNAAPPAQRRQPPSQQQQQRPPPQQQQQAPTPTAVEPTPAPAPAPAPPRSEYAESATSTTSTSKRNSYSSPPAPERSLPPSQRKPPPAASSGAILQPPSRRAPHQRGASAFGSDSPYGALPTGPPSSMYEPPQTVNEIKEEDEEEEEEQQGDQAKKLKEESVEPEKDEEFVPSWMQATAPPPAAAYYPVKPQQEEQTAPPPPQQKQADEDFADGFAKMSIGEQQRAPPPATAAPPPPQQRGAPPPRGGQGPPPSRKPQPQQQQATAPPPRQQPQQNGPPPPRTAGGPPTLRAQPPVQAGGAAPPPARGAPPPRGAPPTRAPPSQQQQQYQAPPPPVQQQQQQQQRPRPQAQIPASPDRSQVPQLNFQAPSPDVRRDHGQGRYDYRDDDYGVQPMSGIEETPEEEQQDGEENDDYFGDAGQQQQQQHQGDEQDSTTYGAESMQGQEEGTGATTPSSAYGGDWQADSEVNQGYDYVNHDQVNSQSKPYDPYSPDQQQQQQQQRDPYARQPASSSAPPPRDPYAPSVTSSRQPPQQQQQQQNPYAPPQDVPSRESTFTPPAQQRSGAPTTAYDTPSRSRFGEPAAKPAVSPSAPMARANSHGVVPSPARNNSTDSYAAYPAQGIQGVPQGGPYSARAEGNLTAPAAYGSSFKQQQAPYDPYAATKPALSRQASFAGESADLGLERRTAPVVSFGLGGRMVVVFPSTSGQSGYTVDSANPYGGASAQPESSDTTVHIRKLGEVVPPTSDEGGAPFPGPIFLDGGKANAGKKRKEAVAWLGARIGEVEQEVKYAKGAAPPGLSGGQGEAQARRQKAETKLLLLRLVLVMIENEGKLTGSPKVDDAVRAIFAPDSIASTEDAALPTADQLAAAASQHQTPTGSEIPFVNYGVSSAHLDQMSSFLLRSERREAVQYALDNKMWAHAFIIASCVDTECWFDVTREFLRSELTPGPENGGAEGGAQGREALRVAYSMFAGLGAKSINEFIPPRALGPESTNLLPPAPIGNGLTSAPLTRQPTEVNGNNAAQPISEATLEMWQDTVGMIVANRTAGDSAALTALGDVLASNGWVAAAHVCYLLSPQTSLPGGFGAPGSRITLLGSDPLAGDGTIDLESVKLTELVEFAVSLIPIVKGQEPFAGFPHLQAFRLYHGSVLADQGHIAQASKYAEAVINTLKITTRGSPFYNPSLVAQIKVLSERFGAAPGQKESGKSWIASKVPRPTVNSLWSTFEGGFNKFVAGDSDPTPQKLAAKAEVAKSANGATLGPFSHYSSISPGSTSGTLSRAQSSSDLASANHLQALAPPVRPLSAAGPVSPHPAQSSLQPHPSPGPPPVKRAPYKGHHARSSSLGAFAGYDYNPNAPPPWQAYTPPAAPAHGAARNNGQESTGKAAEQQQQNYTASPEQHSEAGGRRPQFAAVGDRFQEDDSGFISPMAQYTPSVTPAPRESFEQQQQQGQPQTHRRMTTAQELADLGIGNSKSKKPAFDTLDEELDAEEGGVTPTERAPPTADSNGSTPAPGPTIGGKDGDKPAIKPSKSWLGGWFKREGSPAGTPEGPGPVRAKLGDQKSLIYDKELKRWVNKSGKGEEAPAPVVPPPRAATASPSRALRNGPPRFMSETPPVPPMPTRSATTGPPPLSRSATSADLRSNAGYDNRPPPPSAGGPPARPPSAGGAMPPRSAAGTPIEGGRAPAKRKPKHAHIAM